MSEALLCDICPHFQPCHLGEEISDDDCWNVRRDLGLPLVRPAPAIEPEPVRTPPAPRISERSAKKRVRTSGPRLSPEEYTARKRDGGKKAAANRAETWYRDRCGDGPRPPFMVEALLARTDLWEFGEVLKKRLSRSAARHYLAALCLVPVATLNDLSIDATAITDADSALDRKLTISAVDHYRRHAFGVSTPERRVSAHLRTPEVCAHRREKQARDWEVRHFGEGPYPQVRLAVLATRPDLWRLADLLLDAGKKRNTVTSLIATIAQVPARELADPTISADALATTYGSSEASWQSCRNKICQARKHLGVGIPTATAEEAIA